MFTDGVFLHCKLKYYLVTLCNIGLYSKHSNCKLICRACVFVCVQERACVLQQIVFYDNICIISRSQYNISCVLEAVTYNVHNHSAQTSVL